MNKATGGWKRTRKRRDKDGSYQPDATARVRRSDTSPTRQRGSAGHRDRERARTDDGPPTDPRWRVGLVFGRTADGPSLARQPVWPRSSLGEVNSRRSPKALLDTDIYSEVLKAIDPNVTRNATAYRQAHGFLTVSVISVMEVIQGYQRVGKSRRIQAFRNAVALEEVLIFDQATADLAGQVAGDLDRVGQPIGRCDPMIAAIGAIHGLELATGNTSHYQRVQQIGYPLTLVNWRI